MELDPPCILYLLFYSKKVTSHTLYDFQLEDI
jgi:hypothetical protein